MRLNCGTAVVSALFLFPIDTTAHAQPVQRIRPVATPGACCTNLTCSMTSGAGNCPGVYLGSGTACALADCNETGTPDLCDIGAGLSLDMNGDGVPDECQVSCPPPCDAWMTVPGDGAGGGTFHDFAFGPIPADFFEPGSEAYMGTVQLMGAPLDPSQFGQTDTLVRRDVDPLPSNAQQYDWGYASPTIQALRLVSVQPIRVGITGMDGDQDTFWDVEVGLSGVQQTSGDLWAQKLHDNGGNYDSQLPAMVRFIFRRWNDPLDFRLMDSPYPFYFVGSSNPWVYTTLPSLDVYDNLTINFVAGVEETLDGNGQPQQASVEVDEEDSETPVEHDVSCPPGCCDSGHKGACCKEDGTCEDNLTQDECEDMGGVYMGDGSTCEDVEPCCEVDLVAYRPRHGAGYAPFQRTAVADADEESDTKGPGIRINEPGDTDPNGEDDLIEVEIKILSGTADMEFALRRSNGNLKAWSSPDKAQGTEIVFNGNKTDAVASGGGGTTVTVYIEWAVAMHGTADLHIEPLDVEEPKDTLKFHSFRSIAVFLGGLNQVPTDPANPNHGTFQIAINLYGEGYDAWMWDEDEVANVFNPGSGAPFDEIETANDDRMVEGFAVYGYSRGGGATDDLVNRLNAQEAIAVNFSGYCDAVGGSGINYFPLTHRPNGSAFHFNYYQTHPSGALGLHGAATVPANPGDLQVDLTNPPTVDHFNIDDLAQTTTAAQTQIKARLGNP